MPFLERLRLKPREVKVRYAFTVALMTTLCIAVVWSLSLPARFAVLTNEEQIIDPALKDLVEQAKTQVGSVIDTAPPEEAIEDSPQAGAEVSKERLTPSETAVFAPSRSSSTIASPTTKPVTESPEPMETESTGERGRVVLIATTTSQAAGKTAE